MQNKIDSLRGFRLLDDAGGTRIECLTPFSLAPFVSADFFARGVRMDATEGDPIRIECALQPFLKGRSLLAPYQVHGTAIVESRPIWALPQRARADGVHLDRTFDPASAVTASLRFADCAPVLLASDNPRPWAIALHSGFHGTTKNIFAAAWSYAKNFYGAIATEATFVWLGPAIGACCYTRKQDDPSTVRACATWHPENFEACGTYVRFDLHGEIAAQIRDAGIPLENVFRFPLCTRCNTDRLYSYRGGDEKNRMTLLVKLKYSEKPQMRDKT